MKELAEGTIGVVWMKGYRIPEVSIHRYVGGHWHGDAEVHEVGTPGYNKLLPILSLLHNPQLGAEAFYFSPEEYAAIMEGP